MRALLILLVVFATVIGCTTAAAPYAAPSAAQTVGVAADGSTPPTAAPTSTAATQPTSPPTVAPTLPPTPAPTSPPIPVPARTSAPAATATSTRAPQPTATVVYVSAAPARTIHPAVTPKPTATPASGVSPTNGTITLDDNGRAFAIAVGERFSLNLGTDYDWTVSIADGSVLARVRNITVVRGSQGVFEGVGSGTTTLSATGDPPCRKSTPPCAAPSILFQVEIAVR